MNKNTMKSIKREPKSAIMESSIIQTMMPNELLDKIFNFLPLKCKKNARLVSKRWCRLLNYHRLVLNVLLSDKTISNVKYFTQPHLKSITVKKLTQDICLAHGGSTNVAAVRPPTISKLSLSDGITYQHLINVVKYYSSSNIKEIEFGSFSLSLTGVENVEKLAASLTKYNCLTTLKFSVEPNSKPPYSSGKVIGQLIKSSEAVAQVLKHISIPSLATLSLYLDAGSCHILYYNKSGQHPFESIYTQLARFLHRHAIYDKLKCLHLKWVGGFPRTAQFPLELWSKSIIQLDSIKMHLKEYNYDYMVGLLNIQRKVKHIETGSVPPELLNNLLANNSTTIESIIINGHTYQVSFPPLFTNLKYLCLGFHGMHSLQEFLETLQLSSSRSTPTSGYPSLITFNLIDTHFLIEKYDPYFWVPEDPIEDVHTILELILTTFPSLKKIGLIVRGDLTNVSEIKSAAKCILEKLKDLKTMSITISDARHEYFTNGLKLKKQFKLTCHHLMKTTLKKSDADADHYYEKGIEVQIQELKSNIFSQRNDRVHSFKS